MQAIDHEDNKDRVEDMGDLTFQEEEWLYWGSS